MSDERRIGRWDDHEWIIDTKTVDEYLTSLETLMIARSEWKAEWDESGVCPWRKGIGHHPPGLEPDWARIWPDAIKRIGALSKEIAELRAAIGSEKA